MMLCFQLLGKVTQGSYARAKRVNYVNLEIHDIQEL